MNYLNSFLQTVKVSEHVLKLAELAQSKKSYFAYFHGSYNEQTNQSWCSDCDISRPLVEKQLYKFENKKNVLFIKFPIETSAEWKQADFVYRTNKFKLKKVPTLIFYNKGNEICRLTEGELFDEENLGEFFDDCLAQDE
jgi:thiol-disulfide isomerase/thioredoxin